MSSAVGLELINEVLFWNLHGNYFSEIPLIQYQQEIQQIKRLPTVIELKSQLHIARTREPLHEFPEFYI